MGLWAMSEHSPPYNTGPSSINFYSILTLDSGPDDCTFETADLCGFTNVDGDDFDWTQRMGKTPSSRTGPDTDHTTRRFGEYQYNWGGQWYFLHFLGSIQIN